MEITFLEMGKFDLMEKTLTKNRSLVNNEFLYLNDLCKLDSISLA